MLLIVKNKSVENASKILEEDLNIKLPEDYTRFLDKYNGGLTFETKAKAGKKFHNVNGFYGVGDVDEYYSFNTIKSMMFFEDLLEKNLLTIADDVGGDYYCISLDEEYYGNIYFVYHDLFMKRKKIFSNFTEFINNCKSEGIGYIPTMEEREATAIANGFEDQVEKLRPIWKEEIEEMSKMVEEEVILD